MSESLIAEQLKRIESIKSDGSGIQTPSHASMGIRGIDQEIKQVIQNLENMIDSLQREDLDSRAVGTMEELVQIKATLKERIEFVLRSFAVKDEIKDELQRVWEDFESSTVPAFSGFLDHSRE